MKGKKTTLMLTSQADNNSCHTLCFVMCSWALMWWYGVRVHSTKNWESIKREKEEGPAMQTSAVTIPTVAPGMDGDSMDHCEERLVQTESSGYLLVGNNHLTANIIYQGSELKSCCHLWHPFGKNQEGIFKCQMNQNNVHRFLLNVSKNTHVTNKNQYEGKSS